MPLTDSRLRHDEPRVRWRRAYRKIRVMLSFGADLEALFAAR